MPTLKGAINQYFDLSEMEN